MIKTMKKGVIVTNLNGLHAGLNPVSTEFSLQSEGFYVEDGVIVVSYTHLDVYKRQDQYPWCVLNLFYCIYYRPQPS